MNILDELKSYYPKYEIVTPITKKLITFSPFKVKDAKNLSIILQEDNKKLAIKALVDILKQNINGIDINSICIAEAEYLFLQIRAKSIGESISIIVNDKKHTIDISDVNCVNTLTTKKIKVSDNIVIELESPTIEDVLNLKELTASSFNKLFIKKIIVKNEIYEIKKFVNEEIVELLDNLPINVLNELNTFAETQPKLYYKITFEDNTTKEIGGLLDFFTFR